MFLSIFQFHSSSVSRLFSLSSAVYFTTRFIFATIVTMISVFMARSIFFILTVFHRDQFIWLLLFLPIVAYLHHGIVALLQRSCYQTALTDLKFKIKAFAAALSLIGKMSLETYFI